MGEHGTVEGADHERRGAFMQYVLTDLLVLEQMLAFNLLESRVERIGAEQEIFLIDHEGQPAPVAAEILQRTGDARLTSEIGRFNLEANATPQPFSGRCLQALELELNELLSLAGRIAEGFNAQILLTGILPTLSQTHLTLNNLTDAPRYHELNRALTYFRGDKFHIHIKGLDEIHITHDNAMLEACNTSFQVHLQVNPSEFADRYNLAQAITAPVLAAAVNSPVLFGKRLWNETRLALFQHSVDERSALLQARHRPPRVSFGDSWVRESVLEIYREDIARFPVIMTREALENSDAILREGGVPNLTALRLFNGTIWRWNRPCYGIFRDRPHLRIENRVLPAGPTILDEIANAAFFLGLMSALLPEYGPVDRVLSFDDAKANFFAAARHGLQAQFSWIHGRCISATDLILKELLPLARKGLDLMGVWKEDANRYLDIIEERVRTGQTGAQWTLRAFASLKSYRGESLQLRELTLAMLEHEKSGEPVHRWPIPDGEKMGNSGWKFNTVEQLMSKDLFTVHPYDVVNFAASIMDWEHLRHVPVEDDEGKLVGLITHRDLLKLLARGDLISRSSVPVHQVMKRELVTIPPDTPTLAAMKLMREKKVGCLLVVRDGRLMGILTVYDLLSISAKLLEETLLKNSGD